MAAVGAWLLSCALYGRRCGVAGPLGPVFPPWDRGWSPGPRLAVVGCGLSPGLRMAAVGRVQSSKPCMAAVWG